MKEGDDQTFDCPIFYNPPVTSGDIPLEKRGKKTVRRSSFTPFVKGVADEVGGGIYSFANLTILPHTA